MFEINYSKINAYNFCNYLYKFIYIDGNYVKHNWKTSLGISIHKCLRDYAQRKLDLKGMLESFEENWSHVGFSTPQEMMYFYDYGVKLIKGFYEFERHNPSEIFSSDDFFEVFINDEFVLRGTVDRVDILDDGTLEVIDYKLAFDEKNSSSHRSELQLLIYAYGISKKYSKSVSYISYYYIADPHKQKMRYKEDNGFLNSIINTARMMKNMEFIKKGRCEICLAKETCKYKDLKDGVI